MEGDDVCGKGLQLGDQVARAEVAEQGLVGLGIVVGALDEDAFEEAGDDLGRCVAPHLCRSRGERQGVWFDVAEDQDFFTAAVVPDEESRAVVDAGFVDWVGVLLASDGAEVVRGRGAECCST